MGKGKGKLEMWFTDLSNGIVFAEFKNLRRGRSLYFIKQLTHKLGLKTKPIFNLNKKIPNPLNLSKHFIFKTR